MSDHSKQQACINCRWYRAKTTRKPTKFRDIVPVEYGNVPTGAGECMLQPPVVLYRQAAVDRKTTGLGPVESVVSPGIVQARPMVAESDYCSSFQWKQQ